MTDQTRFRFSRYARGAVLTIGAGIGLSVVVTIVFWDADFYSARDRFEHFKLALFGEWQPRNWCPPGRETENCQQVSEFVAALEGAENFNFFRSAQVAGTDLEVITGVEFGSALDVVAGLPAHLWCYITVGSGAIDRRITLASADAGNDPQFTDFVNVPSSEEQLPFDAIRLNALARSHCQFNEFNPATQ